MKSLSPYDRLASKHGSIFAKRAMQEPAMMDAEVFWNLGREMAKEASIGRGISWLGGKAKGIGRGIKDWFGREMKLTFRPGARKTYKELASQQKFIDEAAKTTGGRTVGSAGQRSAFEESMDRFSQARGVEGARAPGHIGMGSPDVATGKYIKPSMTEMADEAIAITRARKGVDKSIIQANRAGMTAEDTRKALEAPVVTRKGAHGEDISELAGIGDRGGRSARAEFEAQRYLRERLGDVGKAPKNIMEKGEEFLSKAEDKVKGLATRHPVTATAGGILLADKMVS
jgi:hypothetical protein